MKNKILHKMKLRLQDNREREEGFNLIEVLISMTILSFVIVSILNGFAQRLQTDRNTNFKNIAISLAESKLEEYLKFPSSQIAIAFPSTAVDYIVYHGETRPIFFTNDPKRNRQYRRTVTVTHDGNLASVRVRVDYGYVAKDDQYPYQIVLASQRGL